MIFNQHNNDFFQVVLVLVNEDIIKSFYSGVWGIVDNRGCTDADVLPCINKSRAAIAVLKPLWESNNLSLKTK